ncbi:hypothetical protein Shyhy02_30070 [Streptomyces hygroscopicus subsp. hygroscopicus]|nr:hypothetical protein Shyhy02_30070 [Streptomyces hygroscopicus subsp. hygroscopicus]
MQARRGPTAVRAAVGSYGGPGPGQAYGAGWSPYGVPPRAKPLTFRAGHPTVFRREPPPPGTR